MNKIFCLGDGYAHGHIWPEWPQILQALCPEHTVVPITGIGAGNEFLISQLLTQEVSNQKVIFQWAQHNRFDKLLQDHNWKTIAESDPVYHSNFYQSNDQRWWLSSASHLPEIAKYHNFYIQNSQSVLRYQNQQTLIKAYLEFNCAEYYFTSTEIQETFSRQDRFCNLRGMEIQPSPIVHFFFVIEILAPAISLTIDKNQAELLKNRIQNHKWVAYHPDREEIWNNMSKF
jgi:hypothetical protein